MSTNRNPVSGKVWGALTGGTAGLIVSDLLLWSLGVTFFGVPFDASSSSLAVAAVPDPLAKAVTGLVTLGALFFGGYMAKHNSQVSVEPRRALDADRDGVPDVSDGSPVEVPIEEGESKEEYEARLVRESADPHWGVDHVGK